MGKNTAVNLNPLEWEPFEMASRQLIPGRWEAGVTPLGTRWIFSQASFPLLSGIHFLVSGSRIESPSVGRNSDPSLWSLLTVKSSVSLEQGRNGPLARGAFCSAQTFVHSGWPFQQPLVVNLQALACKSVCAGLLNHCIPHSLS